MIYNFQFCETVSLPPKELAGDGPSQGGRYFLMFDQEGRSPQIYTAHEENEVKLNFQEYSESNSK